MEGLNTEQRQAVEAAEGALLIVAGPGTGKTKTLVRRIEHLAGMGIDPGTILALTFTNKAAREMRERLDIGKGNHGPTITTFHALAQRLLRDASKTVLVTDSERATIIKSLKKPGMPSTRDMSLLISRLKNSLDPVADPMERELVKAYDTELHERGLYDFDDLLLK